MHFQKKIIPLCLRSQIRLIYYNDDGKCVSYLFLSTGFNNASYLKEIQVKYLISFKVHNTVAKKFHIVQIKRQFEDDQRLI